GTAIWRMLYFHGTKEQKERYLRPIVGGKTIGGFAFTEPDTGTGVDIKTTAEKRGGSYVLNGTKHLISNSDIASYYHVVAYTDRSKGAQGISCFLVDSGTPGLTIRRMDPMMSYRGVDHGILEFKNCKVSSSQLLGKEGRGMQIAIDTFLSPSRWSIGVSCLGLAQRLLDLSVDFSKKRVTFGKPIAQRQAVQQMLADMATQVFALRCMIDETSRRMDAGKDCIQENSMCKSYGIQAVRQVSDIALEIHGGIGLTKRFPVERLYREGRAMWFEEGTPTIQRMVIARNLLGSR
ncbi:MAG: acyl-CoA dehydrogenase, partial [Chloroflexi bacterium]|nr:acyl-CoA dehydrogenase [Chloroflexota bacterium]